MKSHSIRSRQAATSPVIMMGLMALLVTLPILVTSGLSPARAETEEESCITCHRDPDFLVTNRKLYDYYQDWKLSIHAQEDITCSDCHD